MQFPTHITVGITLLLIALAPATASAGPESVVSPATAAAGLRGVGVNYFNAFSRTLGHPDDRSYRQGLATLAKYEVPFARVMFGGFWPSEMALYRDNRQQFFAQLDDFVRTAEEQGVGIVANLAWNFGTIPDLVGEPVSAWGNKNSATIAFFRQYVSDIVSRYRNSPSIWMWEFINEPALFVDLPNAASWRRPISPQRGTPSARTAADDLTAQAMSVAMAEFVQTVRQADSRTPISSGNALPRPYAWHNSHDKTWHPDTPDQFCQMLARDNPAGYDVISIHIYPDNSKGYFGAAARDYDAILANVRTCASKLGKPVFAGEFGAGENEGFGEPEGPKATLKKLNDALIRHGIVFSAVWVFDFPFHEGSYNITESNPRAYQLKEVRTMNRDLKKAPQ